METQELAGEVSKVLELATQSMAAREGTATGMVRLGAEAGKPEVFDAACKHAEGEYKLRMRVSRLPQPYVNAKSIVRAAMRDGIALASGGKPRTFGEVRREVIEHRQAKKRTQPPEEMAQFRAAEARIVKSKNPLLIATAAQLLDRLSQQFVSLDRDIQQAAESRPH